MDKVLKEAIKITQKQVFVPQKFSTQPKKGTGNTQQANAKPKKR